MAEVEEKMTLYHYTSKDSCIAILKAGKINPSNPNVRDATFGYGVYFTSKAPETEDKELSANNYDDNDGSQFFIKLEVAIKVELPKDKVTKMKGKRDIWLYEDSVSKDYFVQIVVRTGKTIKSYSIKDFRELYIPDNK